MEFVLVPKDPTPEMIAAAWKVTSARSREEYMASELATTEQAHALKMKKRWAAMLAAAPKQPK